MFISGFGLLMAPEPISLKTIDIDSTVSQHSKEMLLNLLLEESSLLEKTIHM